MALGQGSAPGRHRWLVIADQDRLLRESLCLELAAQGYRIAEFDAVAPALARQSDGGPAEALIVDARLAAAWEGDPRAALAAARAVLPVILLAEPGQAGAATRRWGAAEVIDRTQPVTVIGQRLQRAIQANALLGADATWPEPRASGPLSLSRDGSRAYWKGRQLELTEPELALLYGLAARPGESLTYRRARELLAGFEEDVAEIGPEQLVGLVRRIRKKFREVDPGFDHIAFVPGCGYRWREMGAQLSDSSP